MFLKQEKPEMDEFERNLKKKYFKQIFWKVFNGYPCKNVTNIFAYSFVSKHNKHFILFWEKKYCIF